MHRGIIKCTVAAVTVLALSSGRGSVTLFDFEDAAVRSAQPAEKTKDFSVCMTNDCAASGGYALHFVCPPWRTGLPPDPEFTLTNSVTDWRGFDRLVLDVTSYGQGQGRLKLAISEKSGTFRDEFSIPEKGMRRWVVPLAFLDKAVSPAEVKSMRFQTYNFTASDFNVAIDNIALYKKGETIPELQGFAERQSSPDDARHVADYEKLRRESRECGVASGMALGMATSMEKVLPRGPFSARAVGKEGLSVRLARNEYESVQLLVAPDGADLHNVRIRAVGFKDFAVTNIACSVTGYVETKSYPCYRTGYTVASTNAAGYARLSREPYVGWWPDPILGFLDGVDVKGNDVQSFWIRVHCPEGQVAGTYSGSLVVTAEGVPSVLVPLRIRVNGFSLGKTSALPVIIAFAPDVSGSFGKNRVWARWHDRLSPLHAWARHKDEWIDFLADYLVSWDALYHASPQRTFDGVLRLRDEGRLGLFNLGYWLYPKSTNEVDVAAWRKGVIPRLRSYYEKAKAEGVLEHVYTYGCDEVSEKFQPAMEIAVAEVKKALPGVPIMTTASDKTYGTDSKLGGVDWFCPILHRWNGKMAELSRKAGHKVWWYVCSGPKAPYPNMFVEGQGIEPRQLMGAMAVRERPDGFLYYQISAWRSPRCIETGPFTDWDPLSYIDWHGDGQWVCVGPDGIPLPTIRLENFRDGLEDYAYAMILEAKLAVRADKDDEWSRKAKKLLAVPREVVDSLTNYTDDPAVLYRWRDEMADLIEEGN